MFCRRSYTSQVWAGREVVIDDGINKFLGGEGIHWIKVDVGKSNLHAGAIGNRNRAVIWQAVQQRLSKDELRLTLLL